MTEQNHEYHVHRSSAGAGKSFWSSRAFLIFLAFAAMAVTLLWSEHRAHFLGALPYLFLVACPLLHMFGGHGSHGGHGTGSDKDGGTT